MTPEQFRRLSFALIGLFEDVPLDEALREDLERAKQAPEDVWSEDELIHNVTAALRRAKTSLAEAAEAARTEPRLRAAIFSVAMELQTKRRMAPMKKARQETSAARKKRALELQAEGLSAARIAVILTGDRDKTREQEGKRPHRRAINARTVEKWLAGKIAPPG